MSTMNEQKFYELFGEIDPEIIAAADRPIPFRKKRGFKVMLIAAVLAIALLATPIAGTFAIVGSYKATHPEFEGNIIETFDQALGLQDVTFSGLLSSEFLNIDWSALSNTISADGNVDWDAFFAVLQGQKPEPTLSGNVYKSVKLDDGTMKIVEFISGSDQTIIQVPEKLAGATVTVIGEGAFKGNQSITHVSLPDSVTTIEDNAFIGCTSLVTVDLPANLRKIGDNAFFDCTSLTGIDLPYTLQSLGNGAFGNCTSLSWVVIGSSLQEWGDVVFMGSGLEKATISQGVTHIPNSAFRGTKLEEIVIPSSVVIIGELAFAYCESLKTVTLQEGLQVISRDAFAATAIQSILIPSTVESMGDVCFAGCEQLQRVIFEGDAPNILCESSSQKLSYPKYTLYHTSDANGFQGTSWSDIAKIMTPCQPEGFIKQSSLFTSLPYSKSTVLRGEFSGNVMGNMKVTLIDSYAQYKEFRDAYGIDGDFDYDQSYFDHFSIVLIRYDHPSSEEILGLAGLAYQEDPSTSMSVLAPIVKVDSGMTNTEDENQTYITAEIMKSDLDHLYAYIIYAYNVNPEGNPGGSSGYTAFPTE